jgi:hypothetical protein
MARFHVRWHEIFRARTELHFGAEHMLCIGLEKPYNVLINMCILWVSH